MNNWPLIFGFVPYSGQGQIPMHVRYVNICVCGKSYHFRIEKHSRIMLKIESFGLDNKYCGAVLQVLVKAQKV